MDTNKLLTLVGPDERSELVIPAVGCINIATLDALAVAPPEW